MQTALRITTWVRPGGTIEITDSRLPAGKEVDIIALLPEAFEETRPSVMEVLAGAPGHLAFQTAEDVDAYLREERDSWER